MEDKINFSFNNENYQVEIEAYKKNKDIMLPNGILLQVEKWIETHPPQIDVYKVIAETTSDRVIYATKAPEVAFEIRPKINFSFESEDYVVDMAACDKNKNIQLPDGRVLSVNSWIESYPPYPENLALVMNPDYSKTILAEVEPKTVTFTYDEKEYVTTDKINIVQYIQLPHDKILQIVMRDPSNKEEPFYFIEALVDLKAENERENIIKADVASPSNKLKM